MAGGTGAAERGGLITVRPWMRWSAAASAAVLLLSLGWWALNTGTGEKPALSSTKTTGTPSDQITKRPEALVAASDPAGKQKLSTMAVDNSGKMPRNVNNSSPEEQLAALQVKGSLRKPEADAATQVRVAGTYREKIQNPAEVLAGVEAGKLQKSVAFVTRRTVKEAGSETITENGAIGYEAPARMLVQAESAEEATVIASIEPLASRPLHNRMYGTQRIVWYRISDAVLEENSSQPKEHRELWASASVMPGAFNPSVSIPSSQPGVVYANYVANTRVASPTQSVNSRADLSIAYQLSTGMKLGNRWTIETGVGYLEANSTVNSPAQTIVANLQSAMLGEIRTSNLYADALRGAVSGANSNYAQATFDKSNSFIPSNNAYSTEQVQKISNTYQFVQVPVQVGYQLRPRKRLGIAMLGGFLTNWFVKNQVDKSVTIKSGDDVYRPVTLSATTGLRFRYRPTQRWSASFAGMYQQALQNATKASVDVRTKPQTLGMSMGIDYHF
ncbi:hypothetical protein BLX24_21390 [Arsenicibacter rosenii]|uniref:Outer membrane protein beta-barrel domain-containing protein n=2 Tax=Arsenicibacter rosenii TaxID=1750698 RepID=A0A1S2VEH3_9BACT|nr:hypothetical protein BLX24_21390 [Arsenicibacter rosenii]